MLECGEFYQEKDFSKDELAYCRLEIVTPPPNLQIGGCRFGDDPKNSVLNRYCQAHEVQNLFVTDGSFMPTGGSVTYTWTIYANSFRVGDYIVAN